MLALWLPLLTGCGADYDVVPQPHTFEREAGRISAQLNRPAPLTPGLKEQTPTAPAQPIPQPYIIGETGTTDLLAGLSDAPLDVALRFNNADISEVATTILGDILKRPYVLDTTLTGRISLQATRGLSQKSLVRLLQQLVARVGGQLTRTGDTFEITALQTEKEEKLAQLGSANPSLTVLPLKFAQASSVIDLLRAVYPTASQIVADDKHNLLIISGPAAQRQQIANTAALFDVDGLGGKTVAVYPLGQAEAQSVVEELRQIYGPSGEQRQAPIDFLPIERLNAVLVVTSLPALLPRAEALIRGLDQRRTTGRHMYVVPLQHAKAASVAEVLREAVGLSPPGERGEEPGVIRPMPASALGSIGNPIPALSSGALASPRAVASAPLAAPVPGAPPSAPPAPGTAPGLPTLETSTLRIVASTDTNSLLIFATQDEYALLQEAIRRLDAMPLQVLIEATIMDVTLNDQLQFGVQAFLRSKSNNSNNIVTGITASTLRTLAPTSTGFNFIFTNSSQVQAAINALRSVTSINVLSSPQVVTLDNQRATLEVGSQVPITTQQVTQTVTSNPAIVNSISYVQTGVILSVTPRVNSTGGVDLDIRQEVTDAPAQDPNNPTLTPVLTRRVIETRVSVQSTQTVALGGLILENRSDQRNRVPILGDIPILGWLFGQTNVQRRKEELLVFLTPTVFTNPEEARSYSLELRRRIDSLWKNNGPSRTEP